MTEDCPKLMKTAWIISTKNLPCRPDTLKKKISTQPLNYSSAFTTARPAQPRDLGKLWHFFLYMVSAQRKPSLDGPSPGKIHGCFRDGDLADCRQPACKEARLISQSFLSHAPSSRMPQESPWRIGFGWVWCPSPGCEQEVLVHCWEERTMVFMKTSLSEPRQRDGCN